MTHAELLNSLHYAASVATNATDLTAANQALRDHIAGCQECQELAERQRKAALRLTEWLQEKDTAIHNAVERESQS